ncbi:MAG TPA: DUF1653 domain-containing protein [Candidatus Paceibacterota bacterium]|nr:DUF1653 domain-containing protein [Candidatus Paceibacterota bacterium]
MKIEVLPGQIYKHYKGGRYYVLGIAQESTNKRVGKLGVVYISLTYGILKHRDLSEFTGKVRWPDGKKRPRFILE